ncbi:MAG: PEP-CTERM sorting domain-containing protein [Phycisphaerae bacterium]
MLKKFLASVAVLSLAAMAQATITTALIPVFGNAPVTHVPNPVSGVAADLIPQGFNINDGTYYSFDLMVTVDPGDDWTQSSTSGTGGAHMAGGSFFDHPLNLGTSSGDNPPSAGLLPLVPSLGYDSYYQSTDSTTPSYAGSLNNTASDRTATWFSTPPNAGPGTWRVARFTVKVDPSNIGPNTILRVRGVHTTRVGSGTLFPFDVAAAVPEPSTLALVALGGLFGLIRRR